MGQSSSAQIQDLLPPFLSQLLNDESGSNTLLTAEIQTLTYENFVRSLGELNNLSKKCLDSSGKQLIFAVKKGSDSTVFWKATVQIACVKIDPETQKVDTYRLLNLSEFLRVFKTLQCQCLAEQQSKSCGEENSAGNFLTASTFFNNLSDVAKASNSFESQAGECCICMERKPEVSLPCTHSYCSTCIEEWNESHNTCPICREKLNSTEDTWVLSEVPRAEEISEEIRSNLMDLTRDKSPPCSPS